MSISNIKFQTAGDLGRPPSNTHVYIYKMHLKDMPQIYRMLRASV